MKLLPLFANITTVLFDCDGVLWEGNHLLPGAVALLEQLRANNTQVGFVSNNSTKDVGQYLAKFDQLGLEAHPLELVTSAMAARHYLTHLEIRPKRVFVVGETGLINILEEGGFMVVPLDTDPQTIDAVVVGMDRGFTYEKLTLALQAIMAGARFVGTNPDPQFPTPEGFKPGAGAMIGGLARALEREPEIICGKPHTLIATILEEQIPTLNPQQTLMIGDRVTTDLQFALNAGYKPILVKTGFGTEEWAKYPDFPYHMVLDSLNDLLS